MSEALATQTSFDYGALDATTRREVIAKRNDIRQRQRRASEDIVEIGKDLIAVKERLPHGQFGEWLAAEFGWTDRTARRFMGVAEAFKSDNLSDLAIAPSALYALAADSTPQEIRDQFLAQAERGEAVTHAQVKEALESLDAEDYVTSHFYEEKERLARDRYIPDEHQFWCEWCGKLFDESCWHCAGCDQHWPAALDSCPDCGNPQTEIMKSQAEELSAARIQPKSQPAASITAPPPLTIIDLETGEIIDPEEEEDDPWHEQRRPLARRPERLEVKRQTPQDIALIAARNERVELERMRDETHRNLKAVEGIEYGRLDARTQDEWRGCLELARSIVRAMEQHIPE